MARYPHSISLSKRPYFFSIVLASLLLATAFVHPANAQAPTAIGAIFTVRSLDDATITPAPPSCDDDCTLRDAIRTANATEGADIIQFAPELTGEIELITPLTITDDLTIIGPGTETLSISVPGNDFFNRRAFLITAGTTVVIQELTIQRTGTGYGGGIANNGNLTVDSSIIRNVDYNGGGGAFYVSSSSHLTLTNSLLINNRAMQGGGIMIADGTVSVIDSTISESRSRSAVSEGSAIRNVAGTLTVAGSTITDSTSAAVATVEGATTTITDTLLTTSANRALYVTDAESVLQVINSELVSNTGAIVNGVSGQPQSGGIITVTGTLLHQNTASNGGAILNQSDGVFLLQHSTLTGNRATFLGGGAIYNTNASFTIRSSTIQNNIVDELAYEGAGVLNGRSGVMLIENSTISGNRADLASELISNNNDSCGGIYNNGTNSTAESPTTLTIRNSTLSGNYALRKGSALCSMSLSGPGTASITIIHSTITANRVTEPQEEGGGIYLRNSDLQLEGVILAGNLQGEGNNVINLVQAADIPGTVTSLGYNLSDTTIADFGAGDLAEASAGLGPLADNGGPTQTHALRAGSAAIDARPSDGCPATDQRGVTRPFDGNDDGSTACDIGAFELDTVAEEPTDPVTEQIYLPQLMR